MRIAFTTLGCKINQYETDNLRQDFLSKGNTIVPFDAEADVYIINTCSVTAKSDYQCRQAIRSAVRRGQGARVVVTGCYASTRSQEIERIPGVHSVINNRDKAAISDQIMNKITAQDTERSSSEIVPVTPVSNRTRAFLKIQDGCDNRCAYCIVPLARGRSRSVEPGEVIRKFGSLTEAGCPEVVLTGIHVGAYGSDLSPKTSLTDIIASLVSRHGPRLRLSSIEPNEITEGIIGFLGHGLCRHIHIPLQSGDDSILSSMNRSYTSRFYEELIRRISERVPQIAVGADVMVGFPGEEDSEFQNTYDLIHRSPLTHLHVFSYSPRPGTVAAVMKHQVPESVKKTRNEELRKLASAKNFEFRKKLIGSVLKVVVENKYDVNRNMLTGVSDNYIRVTVPGIKEEHIGKEIRVRIERAEKEQNFATLL